MANGLFLPNGTLKPFQDINVNEINESFQTRVLPALHKLELVDDGTVEQILSQEHSGLSVWFGEPFIDSDSKKFVARSQAKTFFVDARSVTITVTMQNNDALRIISDTVVSYLLVE